MLVLTALTMGFLSNFHCIGMCGPIAMAIPHSNSGKFSIAVDTFLYNFGRLITYTILGLLLGFLGEGIQLAGLQENISIIMGSILLLIVITPQKTKNWFTKVPAIKSLSDKFMKLFRSQLNRTSYTSLFVIGLLNGLLPCGMVYMALIAALAFTGPFEPAMFMFLFGLGTTPGISAIYVMKKFITLDLRKKLSKIIPYGVALVAVLLILRGLALGIPYISPVLSDEIRTEKAKETDCCH